MNLYPTSDEELTCPCGAVISEDEHNVLCSKCRARNRWERRATGRRRHPRRDEQTSSSSDSSRDGGRR